MRQVYMGGHWARENGLLIRNVGNEIMTTDRFTTSGVCLFCGM